MSTVTPKLTRIQAELYEAMQRGVICHFMPYMGRFNRSAYYYRNDTMKRCTAAVDALLAKGLAEKFAPDWKGHKVRAKQQP